MAKGAAAVASSAAAQSAAAAGAAGAPGGVAAAAPLCAPSAEAPAGALSRATWAWLGPLLRLCATRALSEADLPELLPGDAAAAVTERLLRVWAEEVAAAAARGSHVTAPAAAPLPSAWRALWRAFGREYMAAAVPFKQLWLAAVLLQVFAVRGLVRFVSAPAASSASAASLRAGVLWVCLATCSVLAQALGQHHVFWRSQRVGMRARTAACGAVYAQLLALRAAPAAAAGVSSGTLANLLLSDTKRLEEAATYFHFTWHGLIELAAICASALSVVGVPALGGVAVVAALVQACRVAAARVGLHRRRAIAATDVRVRLTKEVLSSARAVKMNGWVGPFAQRLAAARAAEAQPLRAAARARAANAALRDAAAPTAALATFAALAATQGGLDAARVFTVLALFNALLRVLAIAPLGLQAAQEARSGMERIFSFLTLPHGAPPAPVPPLPLGSSTDGGGGDDGIEDEGDAAPVALRGEWSWAPPRAAAADGDVVAEAEAEAGAAHGGAATLRELCFSARRGSLTAIVGAWRFITLFCAVWDDASLHLHLNLTHRAATASPLLTPSFS
jgi:ABC-type multidrug transport system fused ATPase/permease subunit